MIKKYALTSKAYIDKSITTTGLASIEREYILKVLEDKHFNISATATAVHMSRPTLYKKLASYEEQGFLCQK